MDEGERERVDRAVAHPVRKALIEALSHSREPLFAKRFRDEFTDGSASLSQVGYHVQVLEREGIVKLEDSEGGSFERFVVLDGPNSTEAIRRLKLT